uniref:Uncharacterized protein n=1 Tax=Oryza barthii TaxID=65489 RepID=A0A0D3EQV5_9ORYZ
MACITNPSSSRSTTRGRGQEKPNAARIPSDAVQLGLGAPPIMVPETAVSSRSHVVFAHVDVLQHGEANEEALALLIDYLSSGDSPGAEGAPELATSRSVSFAGTQWSPQSRDMCSNARTWSTSRRGLGPTPLTSFGAPEMELGGPNWREGR